MTVDKTRLDRDALMRLAGGMQLQLRQYEASMGTMCREAIGAAQRRDADNLSRLMRRFCRPIRVDRAVLAAVDRGRVCMVAGFGRELPSLDQEMIDDDVREALRRLQGQDDFTNPTPDVGWDYFRALRDGLGNLIGILMLDDTSSERRFTPHEEGVVRSLQGVLSTILVSSDRFSELTQLTLTDTRTRLLNEEGWSQQAVRLLATATLLQRPLFLLRVRLDRAHDLRVALGDRLFSRVQTSTARAVNARARLDHLVGVLDNHDVVVIGLGDLLVGQGLGSIVCTAVQTAGRIWCRGVESAIYPTVSVGATQISVEGLGEVDAPTCLTLIEDALGYVAGAVFQAEDGGGNRVVDDFDDVTGISLDSLTL